MVIKVQITAGGTLISISKSDIKDAVLIIPKGVKKIARLSVIDGYCTNVDLKRVIVPKGVTSIDKHAFARFNNLQAVELKEGILEIGVGAFMECRNLEYINFPKSLKHIRTWAFGNCENLRSVELASNIENIESRAFYRNKLLKKVSIAGGAKLLKISEAAFYECVNLSVVQLPDNLEVIDESAFFGCNNLKFINVPKSLIEIGNNAFSNSGLVSIELPDNITKIGKFSFYQCYHLTKVVLSQSLDNIPDSAFRECHNLKKIVIPNNVLSIGECAFRECLDLKDVKLPNKLISIDAYAFYSSGLIKIKLPDSTREMKDCAFSYCDSLEEVNLGKNLKFIGDGAFEASPLKKIKLPNRLEHIGSFAFCCTSITELEIPETVKIIENMALPMKLDRLTLYQNIKIERQEFSNLNLTIINSYTGEKVQKTVYDFRDGENYIEVLWSDTKDIELIETINLKRSKVMFFDINNKWQEVDLNLISQNKQTLQFAYKKLYEWMKMKKFKPTYLVMKNIPIEEIRNFYINGNDKRWGELVKKSKIKGEEDLEGFFKLCYSLGLFSKMGKVSAKAYDFIKREILKKEKRNKYHIRFGEMDIEHNKFNKEFANLVFLYYPKAKKQKFLVKDNDAKENTDYFAAVYNSFDLIRENFSNKRINTNTRRNMLTPELCMFFVEAKPYTNVTPGNEEFAKNVGMYGYEQNTFERAQKLFDIGKNIPLEEITLDIYDDDNKSVSYELLGKDNPLGVILGNITNCCQTLDGVAKSCVEYGLSQRNSRFMVFRNKDKIIGQSWVWYDEDTKKICLDNIEIPDSITKNKLKFLLLQKELSTCLKRMSKSFIKKMEEKRLQVDSITVGCGYNDMNKWLSMFYQKSRGESTLTGYNGYSDAEDQYILYKKDKGF